jgi:hypothetical protein
VNAVDHGSVFAEATDAAPEGAAGLRQASGSEEEQQDDQEDHEVGGCEQLGDHR